MAKKKKTQRGKASSATKAVTKKKSAKKKAPESNANPSSTQATITKVKIYDVLDLWRKKPQQLRFDDTDVLIVTAKAGNKEIKETFFICLKPDGSFNIKTASRTSQARRQKLASFLKYYFKVNEPKKYNLKNSIKGWIGQKIKLEKGNIYIP